MSWERWVSAPRLFAADDDGIPEEVLQAKAEEGNFQYAVIIAQRHLDKKEHDLALRKYEEAGTAGSSQALHNAAVMYEVGMGCEASISKAVELYYNASTSGKIPESKYRLGFGMCMLEWTIDGKTVSDGFDMMREAAAAQNHGACLDIGMMYVLGVGGVGTADIKEGFTWLQRALSNGSRVAGYEMAVLIGNDAAGVPDNKELALRLALHSAQAGHPLAQDLAGQFIAKGLGCEPSVRKAIVWFKAASKNGMVSSKRDWALLLEAMAKKFRFEAKMFTEMMEHAKAMKDKKSTSDDEAKDPKGPKSADGPKKSKSEDEAPDITDDDDDDDPTFKDPDLMEARAMTLHAEAAEDGDAISMFRLALGHELEKGGLKKDPARQLELMRKSHEKECLAARIYLARSEFLPEDQRKEFLALIAHTAADKNDPQREEAIQGLVMLGRIESCGGCGYTRYHIGEVLKKCGRCQKETYCSLACQQAHWKQHKPVCTPTSNPNDETEAKAEAEDEAKDEAKDLPTPDDDNNNTT